MRQYIKKGGVSSRLLYQRLKEEVWKEFWQLDRDQYTIHGSDIQQIAMNKAAELGIQGFQVRGICFERYRNFMKIVYFVG